MTAIYYSNGHDQHPDSACLVEMVLQFYMEGEGTCNRNAVDLSLEVIDHHHHCVSSQQQLDRLKRLLSPSCEAELDLASEIVRFMEPVAKQRHTSWVHLRRDVTSYLRSKGYDAGICKSKPIYRERFSGKYEYMDVIVRSDVKSIRLLVDIDFKAQFEIARPTTEYSALVHLPPDVYVGNGERLQKIVKIMAKGIKASMRRNTMPIPPWRRYGYLHSMWLDSHKLYDRLIES